MKNLDINFIKKNIVNNIIHGYIKKSTLDGFGLFATKDINKNEILCILDGQVILWSTYEQIKEAITKNITEPYSKYFFMEWNAIDKKTLLVRALRTKYSYINHSRDPNTKIAYNPMRIIAIKKIVKDEEITLDYRKEPLNEEYIKAHGNTYL